MLEQASLIRACTPVTWGHLRAGLGWGQGFASVPQFLEQPGANEHSCAMPSHWTPAQCIAVTYSVSPPTLSAVSALSFKDLGTARLAVNVPGSLLSIHPIEEVLQS